MKQNSDVLYFLYFTTMAFWAHDVQLLIAGTNERQSAQQVHELPQSHCGDNRRARCFHDGIYVTPILLL